jgi:hypothetical protein
LISLIGIGMVALIVVASQLDEGEVATLFTVDARGIEYENGLWVVDLDGVSYLRAESPDSYWFQRIQQIPDVELERSGRRSEHRAIPIDDPSLRESISRAMAEKYGCFDRALLWFRDHSRSVLVKLQSPPARHSSAQSEPGLGVSS